VLNEWLTASGPGAADWIELFNRSPSAPASLQGLYLGTRNAVQQIRSLSFVAPRGYIQILADNDPGAAHLNLNLAAEGGTLRLVGETAVELDAVSYGLQQTAVSEGRLPDGASSIQAFPGTASPGAANYVVVYSGPRLNEVLARNDKAVVSPWGNYCDWVELYNPGGTSVGLGGMGLGDSFNASKRWVFPPGTSIGAGEHLVIWCDGSRPASTLSGSVLNSGFNLSGNSGAVVLFNLNGQPVDSVTYGFQIPDRSIGMTAGAWKLLTSPTPRQSNSSAAALGSAAQLRINEWMASSGLGDDWVELFNLDPLPVDMAGLYLTDDPSITGISRFRVAPLSFIDGRGWAVWQADGNSDQGSHHASFSLNALGETLRLYDPNFSLIDVQDFGLQQVGVSSGRLPDGAPVIVQFPASASPEESNYLPLTNVVINEILAHSDPPLEDAIELFNTSDQPVNMGGWFLSDSQNDLKRYRIPDNTFIQGREYAVFYQNQFGSADGEQDVPPRFSLNSAHGDAVYLSEADESSNLTGFRAGAKFGATANRFSAGRHVTSAGVDFVPLSRRTFGVDDLQPVEEFRTGTGLTNAPPLVGPVVISEIMYHPPSDGTSSSTDLEYVELHNAGIAAVQLFDPVHVTNRWKLGGGIDFEFPSGTSIPAGGCLVAVPFDPSVSSAARAAFEARYGAGFPVVGPYGGNLNNAGETIELLRPDAPQSPPRPDAGFVPYILIERVSYVDTNPWPASANGWSNSLHRVSRAEYANDPVNWIAAAPTPGTVPGVILDADADGMPDWWEDAFGTSRNVPDAGADPDEDGFTNMQEYLAGTLPLDGQSSLKLSISSEAGLARLRFAAASNRTYSVLFKNALEGEPWLKLQDIQPRTTNWLSELTDALGTTNRFYRLLTPRLP
jgi:hypothetical protein